MARYIIKVERKDNPFALNPLQVEAKNGIEALVKAANTMKVWKKYADAHDLDNPKKPNLNRIIR